MWLKCSEYLLNSTPFRLCTRNLYKGDKENAARAWILMQILVMSANGISWIDAEDLARDIPMVGRKSCDRVWDICINCGVLRPVSCGYSAIQWLSDNKYFSASQKSESKSGF